jgi:hypothetical protein
MIAVAPATDRQVSYLTSLLDTREVGTTVREDFLNRIATGTLDKRTASSAIDMLRSAPRIARAAAPRRPAAPAAELEMGMYRHDGQIYRVMRSRESGRLYAKRLVLNIDGDASFEYARGAVYTLTADDRMSLEEAKAWGVEMGICCVCAAVLTNPVSVAAGIGPICGGRV